MILRGARDYTLLAFDYGRSIRGAGRGEVYTRGVGHQQAVIQIGAPRATGERLLFRCRNGLQW